LIPSIPSARLAPDGRGAYSLAAPRHLSPRLPVPGSTRALTVATIMAPVPMMSVVPMTTAAASAPSSSHVIQLEPSEVVVRDWLCGHLFRRRSDRQRSRAPNVQTEGGDGANEPGQLLLSLGKGSPRQLPEND